MLTSVTEKFTFQKAHLVGPFPARGRRVALKACQRGRLELLQTGMPGKGCVAGELCCRRCQEKHSRN
jgi:hypothetical protein